MAKRTNKYMIAIAAIVMVVCHMIEGVQSHNEENGFHCDSDGDAKIVAEYMPGIVSLDGNPKEWGNIMGYSFPLLPALDPDIDKQYTAGEMTVKALHDGHNIFFLLQVPGAYRYVKGKSTRCPSVALMFQVGNHAAYHNMGDCKETSESCSSKSCHGHEVDIMHFSIGTAIPGRLYGANIIDNVKHTGADTFGHLVDLYAWNPHCRYLDGLGPEGNGNGTSSSAQNDWQGGWWHDSIDDSSGLLESASPYSSSGDDGTYAFEFARPLHTLDHLQQDVQFSIGQEHKFSAAFWYPVNENPWTGSSHYSVSCDWVTLEILPAEKDALSTTRAVNPLNVISLVLSLAAFCMSLFIVWSFRKGKAMPFTPIDHL
uniref:Cytochrome c-552/DMSO reductase-like haem-binding domain-containing protein n=1 Tax=Araucaria cunninghamii TaxID=56994 RepID=A0A0D6R9N7_ARACU